MESAWRTVRKLGDTVTLVNSHSNDGQITFEGVEGTMPIIGTIDAMRATKNAKVKMAIGAEMDASLAINVKGPKMQLAFTPDSVSQLILDHVNVEGAQLPAFTETEDSQTLRVVLRDDAPSFEIHGGDTGMLLILGFPLEGKVKLFSTGSLLVRELEFLEQGKSGNPVSPKNFQGKITGDGFNPIEFRTPDYLSFGKEDVFEIKLLEFNAVTHTMHMRFDGTAHKLKTGTAKHAVDHRLTAFDYIIGHPYIMALLGIVLWMVPTTLGGWQLFKDLKK